MNRKKKGLFSRIAVCSLALSMALLSGCQQQQEQSGGRIAVICQAEGVQFWDQVKVGAEEAGEEMNYEIDFRSTQVATDIDGQRAMIQEAVRNHVKGIVIAPNSPSELNEAFQAAENNDIPVITISSTATYPGITSYIGSDNNSAGEIAGRQIRSVLPSGGKIAVIGHSASARNAKGRIDGFKSAVETVNSQVISASSITAAGAARATAPYSVVITEYSNGQRDGTKETALKVLREHPEVDLIFATNENSTLGVCDAIVEEGRAGTVKVIGFNASEDEVSYINNGTLTGTVVQSPYNMGYLAVRYIAAIDDGTEIRPNYETGAMYVSKNNINDDIVQLWLDPAVH